MLTRAMSVTYGKGKKVGKMIKLEIINHLRSCVCGEYHWINHSCIQMMRGDSRNIAGVSFVRMVFTPDIMKVLPYDKSDGYVCVKGTVEEILRAISEVKGEVK